MHGLAQTRTIHGRVTDAQTGEALAGVSVTANTAAGRERATSTDDQGAYRIEVSAETTTLVFQYVGRMTLTEEIDNRTAIDVQLENDEGQLDEVVVVGYTSQKKATLTGAVSTISGDDMIRTKNENVLNMLTGKVPGIRVVQRSSAPGAYDTQIDIRGMGDPLFVIDGIPRDRDYFARMSAEEIESVSVLKDGTAAIYGLRAANGVVLVTTKSGTAQDGKVDINFTTSSTMQQFLYVPESVNAIDYMTLRNEQNWQDFGKNYLVRQNPMFAEEAFQPYLDGTKQSYNWMDQVFRKTTPQFENNLSVNGGSEKLRYYFTLGYLKQEGSYKSGDYHSERWNMRANVDAQITKRLTARVSLGGIMDNTTQPNGTGWSTYKLSWLARPDAAFYANDNPAYPNGDSQYLNEGANMIVQTDADYVGYNLNRNRRFNGTLTLQYDIPGVEGLSAKGLYDYTAGLPDYKNYKRAYTLFRYNPDDDTYAPIQRNTPSDVTRGANFNFDTDMQLGLFYNRSFGAHNFNNFLIYEEMYNSWDSFSAYRELMVDSEYLFAGEDKNQRAVGGDIGDRASKSLIGQLDYNYAGKYMFAFKFRYDGSSRFPEGSRYGFFPSVSAAWRISEENFIKDNLAFLSEFKLRGSYGEMGDDSSAGNYPPRTGYNLNGNEIGWFYDGTLTGGVSPSSIPNPDLTWYRIKSYNLGLDFGLLQNKLNGTIDVFRRDRSGLLATSAAVIPGTVGASLPQENLNSDRNFGYEVSLDYRNRFSDLSYYVRGQVSATKHMRTDWLETPAGNSYDYWRNRTSGRYTNIWWGQESGGMFTNIEDIRNFERPMGQNALPGDWWLVDWNEDGVIDGNDEHPIATYGLPVFNYGISLGASWKGIDIALDFQGANGVYVQYAEVLTEALPFGGQNTLSWFMDRWRPADPNADYFHPDTEWIPGYYPVTGRDGRRTGTNGIQNASYMRLKTAEIGYTFPDKLLSRIGVKNLRAYVSGYNLLTFTGLQNVDPERPGASGGASTSSIDFYNYPVNRTFTIGASVRF
ncbi:TonB-linked outer membrane protein, SusC/RagA family [Parapedobacter luteus]|uniref:TonB-linked outer membrane protein, SusC/RagA family n=2 Tax=Sphingobacteriaceae TaxID=84566 RepID=A0A1T5A080_9SPHI|nr:TonB-linked outer membrane protein, SusC/RagA family [Parapedobacter luteus]